MYGCAASDNQVVIITRVWKQIKGIAYVLLYGYRFKQYISISLTLFLKPLS